MNKLILAALLACCGSASATVLTFDDLNANGLPAIPDGYGGFVWDTDTIVGVANGAQQSAADPGSPGFGNGIVSAPNVAFNFAGGSPTTIVRQAGDTFTFNSAYFTSSAGTQQLTFAGLAGGSVLYTSIAYTLTDAAPLLISLDWSGIDTLQILTNMDGTPPWVMDDFTFGDATGGGGGGGGDGGGGGGDTPGGNPVPEPFSLSLMGLGLATLGALRRRKG